MKYILSLASFILVLLPACSDPPEYPVEPIIEFVEMSKNEFSQSLIGFSDSIMVTLSYTDGDGDLGLERSDTTLKDLLIIDTRQNNVDPQSLPEIPSFGGGKGINGELRFSIRNETCCLNLPVELGGNPCDPVSDQYPAYQLDTIIYEVQIFDRAGNGSNVLTLPPVYLRCD